MSHRHDTTTPPSGDRQHVPTDQAAPELLPCARSLAHTKHGHTVGRQYSPTYQMHLNWRTQSSLRGIIMDDLKNCPFCGGNNVRVFGPVGWYRQFGISHSCQAFHGGSGDFTVGAHSREEAISAWNRRADLAAPSAPARERCGSCGAFGRKCYGNGPEGPDCDEWIGETDGRACCYACYGAAPAPAEVEGLVDQAGAEFADYFRNNYPGPDTIIHDPEWHAPKLFRAATHQFAAALTALQAENERLRGEVDAAEQIARDCAQSYERTGNHAKSEACLFVANQIAALRALSGEGRR